MREMLGVKKEKRGIKKGMGEGRIEGREEKREKRIVAARETGMEDVARS